MSFSGRCWLALSLAVWCGGGPSRCSLLVRHDVEVQVISPRPGLNFPGAVPLRARLVVPKGADAADLPPGWALSISLDEDGESTVVPGVEVDGELPQLSPGPHSITIALVDNLASGALLGPRSNVHFTVGASPPPPEIIIESPEARLQRRASPSDAVGAQVRVTQLQTLEGGGWTGKVAVNGVDVTTLGGASFHSVADGGVVWSTHIGHLPDGLHVLDAELADSSGVVFSRDRRWFELLTTNASHPRGGIEYAADRCPDRPCAPQ